ncbi:MAG TPA: GDSL-type esterase/lipase family protein [Rariglobus sp.]|jgi:lysophospholipase L1-like esterase|nr:GDSL-type esterase/lipase family protein [Rariglobus sp.]
MKIQAYLAALFVTVSAFAQNGPTELTIKNLLPPLPVGANSAAVAAPKLDWVERVKTTNERAHKQADQIQLVFDGDSITDGWQGRGREVWAEHYGKLGAFDFGISGDRTEHVLWRLNQGQVEGLNPKLIAVMIGTNNLGRNSNEQIAEGVTAIVKDYQKRCPNAVILLQAIFPRGKMANDPNRARIKAINAIISKLGDGKKVVFIDFGDKFLEPDGSLSPEIMPDFLHPSAKGYEIWANAIQPVIDTYFAAKR